MRYSLKYLVLVVCVFLPVHVALSQPKRPRTSLKSPVQTKLDLGKLSGNTYTNDFFNLKFEFPLGWLVGDHVLEEQLKQVSQPQVTAKNPGMQGAVNQAVDRVTILLGGYKQLPGMSENASLRVGVENLRTLPQIKTGRDYFVGLVNTLKAAKLPADFKYSEVQNETVSNVSLYYIETASGGNKKRMYAAVRKGYAILMTISYYEDEDFRNLHKVLTESDLNYKK